jgi:hypothetical protein
MGLTSARRKIASRIVSNRREVRGGRSRRGWVLLVEAARGYSVIGARRKVASRIGVLFAEVWCDEGGKAGREKAGREEAGLKRQISRRQISRRQVSRRQVARREVAGIDRWREER